MGIDSIWTQEFRKTGQNGVSCQYRLWTGPSSNLEPILWFGFVVENYVIVKYLII